MLRATLATHKHSDEIDGVRCLCARISRIRRCGPTTRVAGRSWTASPWPPVGARVNGPSGSTQSAPARDQLLTERLIIELLAIASAHLVKVCRVACRLACEKSYLRPLRMNSYRRLAAGLSICRSSTVMK